MNWIRLKLTIVTLLTIVCTAQSQILLSRIEAEKINTKLIYCEKLQLYCDSLNSIVAAYDLKINNLEQKNELLKAAIKADSIAYIKQTKALELCKDNRSNLLLSNQIKTEKISKLRRRRWWLFGGGIVAGFVGGVLLTK